MDDAALQAAILALTSQRGASKSICPSEAARDVAGETAWQNLMPGVRRAAIALAEQGKIEITRKGKAVDPKNFKGVYRLRARADGDA